MPQIPKWLRILSGVNLGSQIGQQPATMRGGTSMRKNIEFKTDDGVTLRGWHYVPDGRQRHVPTIVMAHGFSAVKEMYLDRFAEA